ncbi:MAG: tRNA(Ile)(2)-agmatinylcytidine synthase [Candidatus Thermoplasmatota archaeon]|nr:tRNA(Ile)(2)-agmatinylcytidine synthase [Candidatus Thermoplasmatota archaeon]MCL5730583.1 tRNA(Ile)(2)-agmatinylcytidine synthase [Candidatus Thermoplasmatota archaeon]
MIIGIDDTDSPYGGCTTYLLTRIIEESGLDLIGFPRLVRLNPNVAYCTRGNAALSATLGHGRGKPSVIGRLGSADLESYPEGEDSGDMLKLMSLAEEMVMAYREDDPNTNPGIVVTRERLPGSLYRKAVSSFVSREEVEEILRQYSAAYTVMGNGRGLIGASAAVSWPEERCTYELISYSHPYAEIDRAVKTKISISVEETGFTFDSYDAESGRSCMFPASRTPVVFGIRGRSWRDLLDLKRKRIDPEGLTEERFVVFRTNQATDDHIIGDPENILEGHSYAISGFITSDPWVIPGGHYFAWMEGRPGRVKLAAFEPTKGFRNTFRNLRPGDFVTAYGSFNSGSLHLEKLEIISTSVLYRRQNPLCSRCRVRAENRGRSFFKCPSCGTRYDLPEYVRIGRNVDPGRYDVPSGSRRHLTKPFYLSRD